jgi:hypothetical protein
MTRLQRATIAAAFSMLAAGCAGAGSPGVAAFPNPGSITPAQPVTAKPAGKAQRLLFISILTVDQHEIDVYPADISIKNPRLIRKITTGITTPAGIWLDAKGTLYVVNTAFNGPGNVVEYPAGSSTPSLTIPGILNAAFVAVDSRGFVYVSGGGNFGNNGSPVNVFVYAPGSTKLVRTITLAGGGDYDIPGGLAFDNKGDLFAAQLHRIGSDYTICIVKPGAVQGDLFIDGARGSSLAIDGAGNMYVGDNDEPPPSTIDVYAPGAKTPSRTISGGAALSVTSNGTLYGGYGSASEFDEYAPGASSPTNTFQYGTYGAGSSAVMR